MAVEITMRVSTYFKTVFCIMSKSNFITFIISDDKWKIISGAKVS